MSNQISIFNFKSFPVRIQSFNNEPYFALKDVCIALSIQVASPERFSLDPQGVTLNVIPTTSGNQELTFINEPNLYRIIFKSRKAEAVAFQNWVFEEVLPQIRKTGQYQVQQPKLPVERTFNHDLSNHEAVDLAWLWFEANQMAEFIKNVTPALEAIHSGYAPMAHSMGVEYRNHIHHLGKLIYRLSAEADFGHNPKPITTLNSALNTKKQIAKF